MLVDELIRALADGGPSFALLTLSLWGAYRLASRFLDRWLKSMDTIVSRISTLSISVARLEKAHAGCEECHALMMTISESIAVLRAENSSCSHTAHSQR